MTQIIVVGGTKGGPGKSTVAQQIAVCLKVKRKRSPVTDIDIQRTTTAGVKTAARMKILS
jgi:chromosome partitioning protein